MTNTELTLNSPWKQRFQAWLDQRFPLVNGLLFCLLYAATAVVVRTTDPESSGFEFADIISALATWSFFLLLRVFDEHKDYQLDCLNHPERVLQQGLITLNQLKLVGAAAIAVQVLWSIAIDGGLGVVFWSWVAMFIWLCLMGKEFFAGEWLEPRLHWYALTHMIIMPFIVFWLAAMAVGDAVLPVKAPVVVLMLLAFVSGFCFEITRKTMGPEEERDTIVSYSQIAGTRNAAWVVVGLVTAMVALQALLLNMLIPELANWPYWVLLVAWLFGLTSLIGFIVSPSAKARERNEGAVALTMLLGYGLLVMTGLFPGFFSV